MGNQQSEYYNQSIVQFLYLKTEHNVMLAILLVLSVFYIIYKQLKEKNQS